MVCRRVLLKVCKMSARMVAKDLQKVCKNGCIRFEKCLQEWLQKICKLFPPIVGYQINLYTPVQAILYSFCIPIYARNVPLATLLFIANNLTYVVWYHISIFSLMCRMLYLCYLMLFKNKFHICSLMLYFYQCMYSRLIVLMYSHVTLWLCCLMLHYNVIFGYIIYLLQCCSNNGCNFNANTASSNGELSTVY